MAKVGLRRVRLNQGGYTSSGQYFGIGQPLYEYETEDGKIWDHVRADDRDHAKEKVRARLRQLDSVEFYDGGTTEDKAYAAYVKACNRENLNAHDRHMWEVHKRPKGPLG